MKNQPIGLLVVSGDEKSRRLLETLHQHPLIRVVGVTDPDPDTPAMLYARSIGIPTDTDFRPMLQHASDLILDPSGRLSPAQKRGRTVLGSQTFALISALVDERGQTGKRSTKLLAAYKDIYDLIVALSSDYSTPRLYDLVIKYATSLTRTPAGSLAIFDEQEGEMVMAAARGFSATFSKTERWKVRQGGLTAHILNEKDPFIVHDVRKFPEFDNPLFVAEKIRSMAAVRLSAEGKIVGILYVNDFKPRTFSKEETSSLHLLSTSAATLIEQTKMMEANRMIAITDELTGLANHRHFVQRLSAEIARAHRYKHPLSLVMVDLDYFKHYNDTYGHLKGNAILQWVAQIIRFSLREADVPARYGGEEFAIIMPETPHGEGKKIAERLRTNIEKTPFGGINAKVRITASMGVAAFPKDATNLHDLIDGADRALYQAKSSGRNQTCLVSQISKTQRSAPAPGKETP